MAIKPVEYVKDSSTSGFAVAGDQKTITKDNANTIRKDADQGNTKDLDNAQEKYLEGNVDYDTLDYSDEEMGKVGEQQIDTEDTENTKAGNAAGTTAGVAASSAAFAVISATLLTQKSIMTGWTAPAVGAAYIAVGVGAKALVNAYDDQYKSRVAQRDKAADTNAIMQQYVDTLNNDMDMMNEDINMYQELSDMQTQAQVETITDLGSMQAELQVYQAQGNTAKVAEIKAKMEDTKKISEEDSKGPQEEMDGLKENIATYTGNNSEAQGVARSGATVSEFLKDGKQMGILGYTNTAILAAGAITGGILAAKAISIGGILSKIPGAIGAALCLGGIALYLSAATSMMSKSKDELKCADAGDEMAANVNNLESNIEGQAGFTEATSGTYGETDEAATETIEKNQESTDKANGKGKNQKTKAKKEDEDEKPVATPAPTPTPAPATAAA